MYIKFDKKFTDLNLDEFVHKFSTNVHSKPQDSYEFDLSETEYVSNQELLVFTASIKLLFEAKVPFEVIFFKKGQPLNDLSTRVKFFIIQIWDVWKIWKIVEGEDYKKYFGIDGNAIERLKKEINYYPKASEIYTRHGITPFIPLDYIKHYNARDVEEIIQPIYNLNTAVTELLAADKCYHPFTTNSLSSIITEELYLNFLDHSKSSSFGTFSNEAFMSIAFQRRLEDKSREQIQKIKSENFKTEVIPEAINFFFDSKKNEFKNFPFLQFSFLDFGTGIPNSLRDFAGDHFNDQDYAILDLAFDYDSSRHPIDPRQSEESFISRGLFDVLILVKRYKGLLVVRSNKAKILYDFSGTSDNHSYKRFFTSSTQEFPGTLITIYIPALEDESSFDVSAIKPKFSFGRIVPKNIKLINFSEILLSVSNEKEHVYNELLMSLKTKLVDNSEPGLTILNFEGLTNIPKNILKKTLYYLLSSYEINHVNNVALLNLEGDQVVSEIQSHLASLNNAIKNYKIHPLPILNMDYGENEMKILWLGVYEPEDIRKLNDLLYNEFSLAKSDFKDPQKLEGHLTHFDSYGNLLTNLPSKDSVLIFLDEQRRLLNEREVKKLIQDYNCIIEKTKDSIFLCNGNYYQYTYIELTNLINDKAACDLVGKLLFDSLTKKIAKLGKYKFLGISASSQKVLKGMERQKLISHGQYSILDGYQNIEEELGPEKIDVAFEYILICDVIATGFLTKKLNDRLLALGTQMVYIGVIVDSSLNNSPIEKGFLDENRDKVISLYNYPIQRFFKASIKDDLKKSQIVRINPYTNIPITLSLRETNYFDTVIFNSEISFDAEKNKIEIRNRFLDVINEDFIKIGFLKFNNLIHPYFFDTNRILEQVDINFLF